MIFSETAYTCLLLKELVFVVWNGQGLSKPWRAGRDSKVGACVWLWLRYWLMILSLHPGARICDSLWLPWEFLGLESQTCMLQGIQAWKEGGTRPTSSLRVKVSISGLRFGGLWKHLWPHSIPSLFSSVTKSMCPTTLCVRDCFPKQDFSVLLDLFIIICVCLSSTCMSVTHIVAHYMRSWEENFRPHGTGVTNNCVCVLWMNSRPSARAVHVGNKWVISPAPC